MMLNWRYGTEYTEQDIEFVLSEDFTPTPHGADWLRIITEWYENGLIPRSVFIEIAKRNDIVPPEYDDDEGQKEINDDELIATPADQFDLEMEQVKASAQGLANAARPGGSQPGDGQDARQK